MVYTIPLSACAVLGAPRGVVLGAGAGAGTVEKKSEVAGAG